MHIFKNPGVFMCLSASLFVLGTYLCVIRVPVWVGNEYEPMHAYLPLGLLLWLLALPFFVYGIILGARKPLPTAQLRATFSMVSLMVNVTLGILALTSTVLPWVISERTSTPIETRAGTFNVPQHYALTGTNLMLEIGEVLLVLIGGIISLLTPLLCLLERERPDVVRAFLFLLSGTCIIGPVALLQGSIQGNRIWGISFGQLGIATVFKSPEMGFFIAALSGIGLTVSGVITAIRLTRHP